MQVIVIILLLLSFNSFAENICTKNKKSKIPEDFQIPEQTFDYTKGIESLEFASKLVWKKLREFKKTEQIMNNTEGFGIPFPNSMRIGIGALLKERALHLKYKWIAKKGKESDWLKAKNKFCEYQQTSNYVD